MSLDVSVASHWIRCVSPASGNCDNVYPGSSSKLCTFLFCSAAVIVAGLKVGATGGLANAELSLAAASLKVAVQTCRQLLHKPHT